MPSPVEDSVVRLLEKAGKSYLPLGQLRQRLPSTVYAHMGLVKSKAAGGDLLRALEPHFGGKLALYRGPRSLFIGFNHPPERLILDTVSRTPGVSSKQLAIRLPMRKAEFLEHLNRMLTDGRIVGALNSRHLLCLRPGGTTASSDAATASEESGNRRGYPGTDSLTSPELPVYGKIGRDATEAAHASEAERADFRAACDAVGGGRNFIRIHRLRSHLRWSARRFDRVLRNLVRAHTVELHGGDPSQLTEKEIADSYSDKNGTLFITLTWWGQKDE